MQTDALHHLNKLTKNSKNEIISRDLIDKVNAEQEKLTLARLDSIVKGNKQRNILNGIFTGTRSTN